MRGRELLARSDPPFDPDAVQIDDAEVLNRLEPAVREWWVEQFGEYVPDNGGFFTPPQKEAVPHIDEGRNVLVASPTGSGKCVRPDTPLIITEDGNARAVRAEELLDSREKKVADVDKGTLHQSSAQAFSFERGEVSLNDTLVYTQSYDGELLRLQTKYGREVEVTPAHPLLVETEGGREWRKASEISEGDRVGVPERIDLPERPLELPVDDAVECLQDRFERALTWTESETVVSALSEAVALHDLSESQIRDALSLAGLTMDDVADRLGVDRSTVHEQITHTSTDRTDATLELVREEIDPLTGREILVRTNTGRLSRFQYPERVDPELAKLCAFLLAKGLIGEYEQSKAIMITQERQTGLLEQARIEMREAFGVEFRKREGTNHLIVDTPFATFFSRLLGIETGRGGNVALPEWVLNGSREIKQAFVSSFLSLEAEVRENEIRLIQANEMKIEQLAYLLLDSNVFPARSTTEADARKTDVERRREYYQLTIRGKRNLRTFLSTFEFEHLNADSLRDYATSSGQGGTHTNKYAFDYQDIRQLSEYYSSHKEFNERLGNVCELVRRSGYITESALRSLVDELDALPSTDEVVRLSNRVDQLLDQNLRWLEVTSKRTFDYEGKIIDLTVPGPHNFIGGRGSVYLHNTLASFTSIINDLYRRERDGGLDNTVYCLYVSPLKSLANDIHRNVAVPLDGIAKRADEEVEVRHAIRHGDTSDSERRKMLAETPHVLNTTPETLAILLNSPKFKEKLASVEYVIVDEIHALAANKRGTHLSVSLERLEAMCEGSPTRVGCSATVEPLETMAEFLVGQDEDGPRDYEIVDSRFLRRTDLELVAPAADLINTPAGEIHNRFYRRLHALIQDHTNTIVFTNTRSGAERVLHNLRERFDDYPEERSGCHHGSLSTEERRRVETGLKEGSMDVVTTSTSLELGIDMPHVDLVVQVGSPKSVAALLQRVGRAGHQLGETVTGRVFALDRDELVECAVMLRKATEGFVDRVFVPEDAHDVAAQQVYGMAINGPRPEAEVRKILTRAYPFRAYGEAEWETLMRYLTADYDGLEQRDIYPKVWRDANDPPGGEYHYPDYEPGEPLLGKRGRMARVIYMTNVGTIPDSFTCDVFTRAGDEWVGQLDEEYLDTLEAGDVFVLGGSNYEFRYRRGSKVYVDPTGARPTVPSWFSERLPLSYDLGREILAFQGEVLDRLESGGPPAVRNWLREFPLDDDAVRALARMFDEQVRYAGRESVSTDGRLAIEVEMDRGEYERRYYVHSGYGRRFNDGFSRLLAYSCAQEANANVQVAVADNGFTLSMPLNRKVELVGIIEDLDPVAVRADLRASLDDTDLLKRYFRINATRSLMILKRYKGYEKSAAEQQVSSEMLLSFAESLEGFAVIEETYREILEDKLNISAIEDVLGRVQSGDIEVVSRQVDSPSPRAFGLATLVAGDVVLAEDESAVLREFHDRVLKEIEDRPAATD